MNAREQATVDDVADYIIAKCAETNTYLNVLKLHKLLYYVQAWHLAFCGTRAINCEFQAWIHGPVCRPLYDRFRDRKSMYSRVIRNNIRETFSVNNLPWETVLHIDNVLDVYAGFSDDQLEEMTHQEEPWIKARGSYSPRERCEEIINDDDMRRFYSARVTKG